MAAHPINSIEDRSEPRHEVFYRSRATLTDGRSVPAVVVNLSPHGLMVRIEVEVAPGERLRLALPVVGAVEATVRWSLGGRLGCQFAHGIEPSVYGNLLSTIAS